MTYKTRNPNKETTMKMTKFLALVAMLAVALVAYAAPSITSGTAISAEVVDGQQVVMLYPLGWHPPMAPPDEEDITKVVIENTSTPPWPLIKGWVDAPGFITLHTTDTNGNGSADMATNGGHP